jgi:predicted GTPase
LEDRRHDIVIKIVQQTYIARIEEINDILRPVTEINPDALIIAAALDKERSEGMVRGLVCKLGSL